MSSACAISISAATDRMSIDSRSLRVLRVVGAIPAAGKRGESREVEFVGYGVATGAAKLESVKRKSFFRKKTPQPRCRIDWRRLGALDPPFPLLASDLPETVRSGRCSAVNRH